MGRRSFNFEAPPTPNPVPVVVDNSRTRNLRVTGFPEEQPTSSTAAAVPVATIAVPENQAREGLHRVHHHGRIVCCACCAVRFGLPLCTSVLFLLLIWLAALSCFVSGTFVGRGRRGQSYAAP